MQLTPEAEVQDAANLAVAAPAQSEVGALALITLSPEKYAAEVYQPYTDRLSAAIDSVKAIDYDIKTTAGMAVAVKARALFRDLRVAADKEREARKAPLTKIGKLLQSGYADVEARITPIEEMFDFDIQRETIRKAKEKAEKDRIEAERIAKIRGAIESIRVQPAYAVGKTAAELRALLEQAASREITVAEFAELTGDAQKALDTAGEELLNMYTAATEREAAALAAEQARLAELARIEAERAELAKLRAEQAERERLAKIESDRIAAEQAAERRRLAEQEAELQRQRDAEAARGRAEQAARDREAAEQRRQIAIQQEQLAEQQAAFAREQEEARARAEAIARLDVDHAEALPMNVQFDADREAERVRLQALVEQAAADRREQAEAERACSMPAGSLAPVEIIEEETDDEIIDLYCATYDRTRAYAIDHLEGINFAAARVRHEVAA